MGLLLGCGFKTETVEGGSLEASLLLESGRDRSSCQRLWVKRDGGLRLSVPVTGGISLLLDYAKRKCHRTFQTQAAQDKHHLAIMDLRLRRDSPPGAGLAAHS